ncbi:ATP-binding protein [soil metagenome]
MGGVWRVSSLQGRIAASALTTAVAVLLAASVAFFLQLRQVDSQSLIGQAKEVAAVLALRASPQIDTPAAIERELSSLSGATSVREAVVFDAAGHLLAGYNWRRDGEAGAAMVVEARSPILRDGRRIGEVVVRAASHRFDGLFARSLATTGALFFAAAAALFLGRWLAARVVDPVGKLSRTMAEVSVSGDLSRRADGEGLDEIGRITGSFNQLLDRLEGADQTLRRTLSQLVDARDAAEAANVQKSQFLANMSHEIRTPLNGVLAMAQVMAGDALAPEQRRRLEVVRQSGEALLHVLNDVLDVSKIEAGKLTLAPDAVDVANVVRQAVEGFGGAAEAKALSLTLDIAPDALGLRHADPLRLRQVIANLVSNAVKFTEDGAVTVTLRGDGPDGCSGVRVSVADTGIGVASERLPKLFDTFVQGDSSTTRRFGGTGLGLSICRDLVELMGGAIWAESEAGFGSTFHLVLPLPRVSPACESGPADDLFADRNIVSAPAAALPAPTAERRQIRVLAAEDNPTNQLVLSTIMEVFGVALEIVPDGVQAVAAWRRSSPDLILMDIQMPQMDGMEATRVIRASEVAEGRHRTPIIALSANAMTHQVREYLACGMDAHVAKPIELNRLSAALEEAMVLVDAQREAAVA